MRGPAKVAEWASRRVVLIPETLSERVSAMYSADPVLASAFVEGLTPIGWRRRMLAQMAGWLEPVAGVRWCWRKMQKLRLNFWPVQMAHGSQFWKAGSGTHMRAKVLRAGAWRACSVIF